MAGVHKPKDEIGMQSNFSLKAVVVSEGEAKKEGQFHFLR
jgi:hypothetical protein